ncbi:MAG: response regulator [Armatimonadetes bacterium]|nr:response regulator [Armatimonadota bacterium]
MGYRVLVVEDEAVVAVGIRAMVQAAGHEVVGVARTGEDAVEMVAETYPDVALVDIKLPGIDGIETTRRLVAQSGVVVMILTAYADDEFIEGAAEAGAFTYLMKPADMDTLKANIEIAVARASEFALLRKESEDTRSALETRKLTERAKHILMARLAITEENAFTHLRQKCRNQNKTMRQVAEEIISADDAFMSVIEKDPPKKERVHTES